MFAVSWQRRVIALLLIVGVSFMLASSVADPFTELNRGNIIATHEDQSASASSGGSATSTPALARAGYTAATSLSHSQTLDPANHLLGPPTSFTKDGVYIWRDPDGLWTMFWRAEAPFTLSAKLYGDYGISLEATAGLGTKVMQADPSELEIEGGPPARAGVVQFSLQSSCILCTVLIDGKPASERVYIGREKRQPRTDLFALGMHAPNMGESSVPGCLCAMTEAEGRGTSRPLSDDAESPPMPRAAPPDSARAGCGVRAAVDLTNKAFGR